MSSQVLTTHVIPRTRSVYVYFVWLVCRRAENILNNGSQNISFLASKNPATVAGLHMWREGVQRHVACFIKCQVPGGLGCFSKSVSVNLPGHDASRGKYTEACFQQVTWRWIRVEGFPLPFPAPSPATEWLSWSNSQTSENHLWKTEVTTNKETLSWWFVSLVHDVTRH